MRSFTFNKKLWTKSEVLLRKKNILIVNIIFSKFCPRLADVNPGSNQRAEFVNNYNNEVYVFLLQSGGSSISLVLISGLVIKKSLIGKAMGMSCNV